MDSPLCAGKDKVPQSIPHITTKLSTLSTVYRPHYHLTVSCISHKSEKRSPPAGGEPRVVPTAVRPSRRHSMQQLSRARYAQAFPAHRSQRRIFVNSARSTTSRSTSPSTSGALACPSRCNRRVGPPPARVSSTGFLPGACTVNAPVPVRGRSRRTCSAEMRGSRTLKRPRPRTSCSVSAGRRTWYGLRVRRLRATIKARARVRVRGRLI